MKFIRLTYTALLLSMGLFSCSDYLDLEPISEETVASAYDKASQIEAALTGTYETLQSDHFIWNNVLFSEVRSDNYYAGGDNTDIFEMDKLTITTTNSKVEQSWSNLYNGILKANVVLKQLPGVKDPNLTDERRTQIEGEALFLRAYYYYNLVCLYGDVPLIVQPTESADPDKVNIPRSPVADVYDQIFLDLDEAVRLLPDTYGSDASLNKSRATSGAANALAAKASAQIGNYTNALSYIAKVESSEAGYMLLGDYAHLFDGNHYNNAESILEIQYLGGDEGNWGPQLYLPPSISGDTWRKFLTPSHNLINAYDAEGDDIRKNASVLFESITDWVDEFWGNESGYSIPFAYKMKNASGWASSDRDYILRYADILLLKAEALNETDQDGALTILNDVRARVELPALDITDKAELRTAILNERRLELAQEGHRWNDLARHNLLVSTMNNLVEIDLRTNTAVDYNMTDAKELLPIPQSEMDRNPNLVQNPL